jgi:biotin transporter BioY
MALKDAAKTFAGFLIWIVLMIVIVAIVAILLSGTLWLVSIIEPIAVALAVTGILLLIPFLLVSAVFRRTRVSVGVAP